jgi:hypothetical protein
VFSNLLLPPLFRLGRKEVEAQPLRQILRDALAADAVARLIEGRREHAEATFAGRTVAMPPPPACRADLVEPVSERS